MQIENARKDTNLKDFQKLSEWASGFHLPETKQTTSTKTTNKTAVNVQEDTKETTTSEEDFIAPESSNSISRRQGAEALQASAIAQLEAFMFGKYGEQFMQPAFLLIHAIWESAITQQQINHPHISGFNKALNQLHKNPIISALNRALAGADGNHLRLFENNLRGLNLTGFNYRTGLFLPINLLGMDLTNINFSYANLQKSYFVKSKLFQANLKYTFLLKTNFQNADLKWANMQYATLTQSNLYYADLTGADMQYASFYNANLNLANLWLAKLQHADLRSAFFVDTNFAEAQINSKTLFGNDLKNNNHEKIREVVLSRGAIWDDDPNWLIGKIEDKDLLEKIFKDCEYRQKN